MTECDRLGACFRPERCDGIACIEVDNPEVVVRQRTRGPGARDSAPPPRAPSRWSPELQRDELHGGRVLLVGEQNPYGGDPRLALWPRPANASGARLMRVLGMTDREYLRAFDRVNLCGKAWSAAEARRAVAGLTHARRVLLGAKVAEAHGLEFRPFERRELGPPKDSAFTALMLPHPSGRCCAWNDPAAAQRAREAVRALLDDPTRYAAEYG